MTNRTIPCPECGGTGTAYEWSSGMTETCRSCKGFGTIPDRRAPTAAERAVDRIKSYLVSYDDGTCDYTCYRISRIIREEEGR